MTFEKYFILNISIVRTKMAVRQLLVDGFYHNCPKYLQISSNYKLKSALHFTISLVQQIAEWFKLEHRKNPA